MRICRLSAFFAFAIIPTSCCFIRLIRRPQREKAKAKAMLRLVLGKRKAVYLPLHLHLLISAAHACYRSSLLFTLLHPFLLFEPRLLLQLS
ncbi:hypothetical protein IWZ01DRAFT_507522 [Phyllosticta capitalensis]